MRRPPRIRLPLTLADFHPPHVTFNIRRSFLPDGWGEVVQADRDFRTAQCLSVAGSMPFLAGRCVLHPRFDQFYTPWNFQLSPNVVPYDGASEYSERLTQVRASGGQIAFQHVHPPGERPDEEYWIPRAVLSHVNDKANLAELVPAANVPVRSVLATTELVRAVESGAGCCSTNPSWGKFPYVIKGAGAASSGGGISVVIVRGPSDLRIAAHRLGLSESIVVEEFLDVRENFNLTYATHGNEVLYLGASQQRTDASGKYLGNLFETEQSPSTAMIQLGHSIMHQALARGYRGIAGFDLVQTVTNRLYVIDLNFRINGSTPALLWIETLRDRVGRGSTALFIREQFEGPVDHCESILRQAVQNRDLFLLGIRSTTQSTTASLIWLGAHRAEIEAKRTAYRSRSTFRRLVA